MATPDYLAAYQPGGPQYQSAQDAGLVVNEPQPGDPGFDQYYAQHGMAGHQGPWTPGAGAFQGQGGHAAFIGMPGFMNAQQYEQAQQAPAVIPPQQPAGATGVDPNQAALQQYAQQMINQGGFQQGFIQPGMRAPNWNTGPGGVGQGALDLRNQMGMGQFGQAPQMPYQAMPVAPPPPSPQTPAPQAPAAIIDNQAPGSGTASPDWFQQFMAQAQGQQAPATDGAPGAAAPVQTGGYDTGTYPGDPKKQGWMKSVPKDYNAGGIAIGTGPVGYDIINSIEDPGVREMLRKYNDILAKRTQMVNSNYQGFSQNQVNDTEERFRWFTENLPLMGFSMDSPAPGGGGQSGTGMPEGTRPGTDLSAGLPSVFPGNIPAEITRLFGFQPGDKVSTDKMTAAVSAYMDMLREGRGMAGQQLGVNEMDRALQGLLNDPMREQARDMATDLAAQGDPTPWNIIRNQTAGGYADAASDIGARLGQLASRSGIGTGSFLGQQSNMEAAMARNLVDRLGDLSIAEAQSGYDYGLRGIDALTNTFAATQNPVTQARMLLGQALMGAAPYAGSFGGGTNLFDSATGLRAIELAEKAADEAGGGFDIGALLGGLGSVGQGAGALGWSPFG